MKKHFILLVQCLILSSFSYAQKTNRINVMSFNIRYDEPEDGPQNWHHRKENVVRMIKFYDLDIIGMQEVLISQVNYLKENLKEYQAIGVGRVDGKEKGGIEYTTAKMKEYQSKALEILDTYPDSEYKDSLLTMVNYVIERKI